MTRRHQSWPDDRDPARQRWSDYRRDRLGDNPQTTAEVKEPAVDAPEEPAPDLEGFDPVSAAREHWDAPFRYVFPDCMDPRDPLTQTLMGGVLEEQGLDAIRAKHARAWRLAGAPIGQRWQDPR